MAYVAPILIRADAAAVKDETTYGTDSVPTAALNAIRLNKRVFSSITPDYEWANLRDDVANNAFIPLQSAAPQGKKCRYDLSVELRGTAPTAYGASAFSDWHPLMQSSGWPGSFASLAWTYAPLQAASLARPSCSLYVWGNGNQYKLAGCRGNFEATIRAGQIIALRFMGEGLLIADPAAAAVPATTYIATVPVAAVSQACTIGPWTPDYDEIVLRSNNALQWLYTGNATGGAVGVTGLHSYDFGLSRPELVITARATVQSVYDPYVDWSANVIRAFTCSFGSVQYNRGVFSDTALWVPSAPVLEEQKGFTGWRATYRCTAPQLFVN